MADRKVVIEISALDNGSMVFKKIERQAENSSRKIKSHLDRITDSLDKFGDKATKIGKNLSTKLTLPLLAIGTAAFKSSKDFNKAMANVGSLIPGNIERVRQLKTEVQEMAVEVGKRTGDMAEGLYQTISAFGDGVDTIERLRINAKAAAAGLAETTDAINLTSAVTKAYGDTTAEAVQHVADLSLLAVRLGQTTFPELAASIGRVTPLAAKLKVTQEELFAVMATATGVTGNAAEVSTQLRGVLASLMTPSKELAALYKQMGIESGEALIKQKGLKGAIDTIVQAAESTGTPLQSYIGRVEGITLALNLAGEQSDVYIEKLAAMQDAAGTTDEAFREQTEGINEAGFRWAQFISKMEVASQRIGDKLAPALSRLMDKVEGLVDWFGDLSPATQDIIIKAGILAAVIGPIAFIIGKVATAVSILIPMLAKAKTVIMGLNLATGPTIAVIAGLAAVAIEVYRNWKEVKNALVAMWNYLVASAKLMVTEIQLGFERMKHAVLTAVNFMLEKLSVLEKLPFGIGEKFKGMKDAISDSADTSADKIKELQQQAKEQGKKVMESMKDVGATFSDLGQAIGRDIKSVIDTLAGMTDVSGAELEDMSDKLAEELERQTQKLKDELSKQDEAVNQSYEDRNNTIEENLKKQAKLIEKYYYQYGYARSKDEKAFKEKLEERKRMIGESYKQYGQLRAADEKAYQEYLDRQEKATAAIYTMYGAFRQMDEGSYKEYIDALKKYETEKIEKAKQKTIEMYQQYGYLRNQDEQAFRETQERIKQKRIETITQMYQQYAYARKKDEEDFRAKEQEKLETTKQMYIQYGQLRAQDEAQYQAMMQKKTEFEKQWNRKVFELSASRLELLEQEKQEAIAKAEELGASKTAIEQYYAEKRKQIIESEHSWLKDAMKNTFADILRGTKTVTSAFKALWESAIDYVIQKLAEIAATKVFNWIISGGLGGGGGLFSFIGSIFGFAEGGLIKKPVAAVIGEGSDDEAVLPLNNRVYSQLATGIVSNMPHIAPVPAIAGATSYNSSNIIINVTGNHIASDYDIDRIGDRIVKKIRRKTGLAI